MFLRKIVKIFFSEVTPVQLIVTSILGSILGFMPGIGQALGVVILSTFFLIILNTNLTLAFLVGLGAKLVAWTLAPLVFALGRFLLDGPGQGFFTGLINAPVFALFGFEYYSVTGGLLAGLVFGLVVGIVLSRMVVGFRSKMASLEANSEVFEQYRKKLLVRAIFFCLSGGLPKEGFSDLQEKSPFIIRISGVVAAFVLSGVLYAAIMFANGPIAASIIKKNLEQANGATVDLASLELELQEGRMTIHGLAMADPNALVTDLFRAERIDVDIRASDLLRKRINLETINITAASNGLPRETPGSLVGPKLESQSRDSAAGSGDGADKGLDGYMKDAKVWKQRLAQAKRWLDKLSGAASKENREKAEGVMTASKPSEKELDEWLDQQIKALGYGKVVASHLIQGSPSLQIEKLIADKVTTTALDETLNIHGFNLSTQPHLAAGTPRLTVESSAKTLDLDLIMAGVSQKGGDNTIKLAVKGMDTDTVAGQLSGSKPVLSGGTFDVAVNGSIENRGGAYLNLPLKVVLHDTALTIPSQGAVPLKRFDLPLTIRGPLDNPGIIVNQEVFNKAIAKAGKGIIKNRLKKELGKKLKGKGGKILEKVGGGAIKLPF
jgi:uncharacterized protein (TIGR03546 family)